MISLNSERLSFKSFKLVFKAGKNKNHCLTESTYISESLRAAWRRRFFLVFILNIIWLHTKKSLNWILPLLHWDSRLKTCIIGSFSRRISSTSTHVSICLTLNRQCKSQSISWLVEMYLVRPCWRFFATQASHSCRCNDVLVSSLWGKATTDFKAGYRHKYV